jgi:hypothetical protein
MKWESTKAAALVQIAIAVTVILFVVNYVRSVESVKHLKLMDCESEDSVFTKALPPGHDFNLLLGIPRATHLPQDFHIHVVATGSTEPICDFKIASDDLVVANWLYDRPDLQGYILGFHRLGNMIDGRHTYTFAIHFSKTPPPGSSLWLHWLYNQKD